MCFIALKNNVEMLLNMNQMKYKYYVSLRIASIDHVHSSGSIRSLSPCSHCGTISSRGTTSIRNGPNGNPMHFDLKILLLTPHL